MHTKKICVLIFFLGFTFIVIYLLILINIHRSTTSGITLSVGFIALPIIWISLAILWIGIAPFHLFMILCAIDASLIAKTVLLMAVIYVSLGLRLCSAIADIFGIHALNSTSLACLGWRGNVFIPIGSAGT